MADHHHHQHPADPGNHADDYTQATWDARYGESERVWSGNPNLRLVEQVTGLAPGDALDVGAGEGADAVWLARAGWNVTALDVSEVALAKVVAHAEEAGVSDRVHPLHHDLMTSEPVPGSYDLVSAQFWHPPTARRTAPDQLIEALDTDAWDIQEAGAPTRTMHTERGPVEVTDSVVRAVRR
jgi:SAM-dependent methyltransferase